MKQAAGSFDVGAGRNQSRQRRIVERAGPARGAKCVAAAHGDTPVSTRINTTCCTDHKYQRRGAMQEGRNELAVVVRTAGNGRA